MKLNEIASTHVVTLNPDDSIDKALALMEEHDIHHLPVVASDGPIGIVSDRDLLSAVGWMSSRDRIAASEGPVFIGPQRVGEVMSSPVRTLAPDDRVESAARLMLSETISAAPLVNGRGLVGIVTETDFLNCYLDPQSIAPGAGWRFWKVADHMAAHVFRLKVSDGLPAAVRLMHQKHIRHMPVLQEGRLVGIVSDRDLRKACFSQTVSDLDGPELRARLWQRSTLQDIMSPDVQTSGLLATLIDVAQRMIRFRIGALPVTRNEQMVGIITETDLLRAFVTACEA